MRVRRFEHNPIITQDMHGSLGDNINGPSLIRVPAWLPNPLGRYYLYFAHHQGKFIRLAYADDLRGSWRLHVPGTLRLEQTPCGGHIASPDVHVDDEAKRIRMYYHGPHSRDGQYVGQRTFLATSSDGLQFESDTTALGDPYFRVFKYRGAFYAVSVAGKLHRSDSGREAFEAKLPRLDASCRHCATLVRGDTLHLFYSRWGDQPEHLYHATVPLDGDWKTWRIESRVSLLHAERDWEGADEPVRVSVGGSVHTRVHELRDPCVYVEGDRAYLLYSAGGEQSIAIGELIDD